MKQWQEKKWDAINTAQQGAKQGWSNLQGLTNRPNWLERNILDKLNNVQNIVRQQSDSVYLLDINVISEFGTKSWLGKAMTLVGEGMQIGMSEFIEGQINNVVNEIGNTLNLNSVVLTGVAQQIFNNVINKKLGSLDDMCYKFRINPVTVDISRRKLQSVTEYGWGAYDLEMFGDSFTTLSFSGNTGFLIPLEPLPQLGIRDIRLSEAYLNLAQLERFYKGSTQKLLLTLFGRAYMGFLEDMTYKIDANFPTKIDYSFTFKAHPYWIVDIFTGDFNIVNQYNSTVWDSISKPTIAQNISNCGSDIFTGGGQSIPIPKLKS